jgi:hypothetical protein
MRNKMLARIAPIDFFRCMESIDTNVIADTLLEAPSWARTSLADPTKSLRVQAAEELARCVLNRINSKRVDADPDQLVLGLFCDRLD